MEPIKISKNSWHYKLVDKFGGVYGIEDSCDYSSELAWSFLIIWVLLVLFACLAFVLGTSLGIIAAFVATFFYLDAALVIPGTLICMLLLLFATTRKPKEKKKKKKKVPSATRELYKSFKEKYCKPVIFE